MKSYRPTLDALDKLEKEDFSPTISHLDKLDKRTAVENLENQVDLQSMMPEGLMNRTPQRQEEFSNPTIMQGFENLPEKEKLQRLAFSQFDPANQTAEGRALPPGTFEHPITRLAANIAPTIAAPELKAGSGLLSRFIGTPLANSLSRVATGTAGNVGFDLPEIKNKEDLLHSLGNATKGNALLEGATWPLRAIHGMGEFRNPIGYGKNKINQIRNEAKTTEITMNQMYRPVNEKYNSVDVTQNPKTYLQEAGISRPQLFQNAKLKYDEFLKEPTFNNLHQLQSTLGNDWARISKAPASEGKAQQFKHMRENLLGNVEDFLSKDKNALNQYKLASQFAANKHFPYLATPTLRNIVKAKNIEDVNYHPKELAKSIRTAARKTVGKEEKSLIPQDHPLRNHLNDLNNVLEMSQIPQTLLPKLVRENIPNLGAFTKIPGIEKLIKNHILPNYYGVGRAGIGLYGNKDNS